jgi:oligopeptide/dipeptide ABC transporter ATP-binding protein
MTTAVSETRVPPLLEVGKVSKTFGVKRGLKPTRVHAVDDVSLSVPAKSTLGIVGESGCGKSTLARLVLGLYPADSGEIRFSGELLPRKGSRPRAVVSQMQMVFQDSYSALNPRATIGQSIAFPLQVQGVGKAEIRERVTKVLEDVGLHSNYATHYPHQLSGGQRQRVNIARALAIRPKLIVLDEAVSALDKSIQAQILNLLQDLQEAYQLTYIFISHDLNVVEYMSDQVAVMYLGQLVETCAADALYESPLHPYTQALLASIPAAEGAKPAQQDLMDGEKPSPLAPPSGCRFRTLCPFATEICATHTPALGEAEPGHMVACHLFPTSQPTATPATQGV